MAEGTCSERGCSDKAYCRGLCSKCYGKAYRQGTLQLLLPLERHSLSEVDRERKTATCAICGPVRVRIRTGHAPECMTVRHAQNARHEARRNQHGRARSPEGARITRLQYNWGLTPSDYQRMLDEQGGACAICGQVPEGNLSVDHDHRCCPGKKSCGRCIRGLLCSACNIGIGYLRDDPERLKSAVAYLSKGPVVTSKTAPAA